MIDKWSFISMINGPEDSTTCFEFEATEKWLERFVLPEMISAARAGQTRYMFRVNTREVSPGVIRKILDSKGYDSNTCPLLRVDEEGHRDVAITVCW